MKEVVSPTAVHGQRVVSPGTLGIFCHDGAGAVKLLDYIIGIINVGGRSCGRGFVDAPPERIVLEEYGPAGSGSVTLVRRFSKSHMKFVVPAVVVFEVVFPLLS